jgi:hypothetical protein
MNQLHASAAAIVDGREHSAQPAEQQFGVGLGALEVGQQRLDGVADGQAGELAAEIHHLEELVGMVEPVVVAGAGLRDVDGGNTRRSASSRSRRTSMLPVPLNSSKTTSSSRLSVSTSAVARMVSEPPSSTLRAVPKNLRDFCRAAGTHAAGADRAALHRRVVAAGEAGEAVEQQDHVLAAARPGAWRARSRCRPPGRGGAAIHRRWSVDARSRRFPRNR